MSGERQEPQDDIEAARASVRRIVRWLLALGIAAALLVVIVWMMIALIGGWQIARVD